MMRSVTGILLDASALAGDVAAGDWDEPVGVATDIADMVCARAGRSQSLGGTVTVSGDPGHVTTCSIIRVCSSFNESVSIVLSSFFLRIPMASKQANRQAITLKGSTALVTEFFKYAVNTCVLHYFRLYSPSPDVRYHCSILFQREVYPSDDFHMVKKYGQTVLVTQDLALENYLER